ncbi:MAG TPA: phosphate signaling complex protein PhoU [bacterium]|nr:phosphate signaling complex protein PhoU [bacterium]HOL49013.1 phosphate signaling complex protein PhoU [bacterium]HPO51283.1 phosphate signaling complex protein PhoU [bacterium]HXK44815.1 phosphate signaling complex protein PhoU [bacterium]
MIENRINETKQKLIEFSLLVENMIAESIDGLLKKNASILKKIIEGDEAIANKLEIEIEEMCIEIIAQYSPKASYLRTTLMILKINNDLERIGDHAVNIAQSALFLIERPDVKPLIDTPRMAEEAAGMLKNSLKSFINQDAELAKSVCRRDEIVDRLRDQIARELITYMISDPSTIERSLQLLRISQNLERIADLSTNISEDVVFMVEGKIIKHHSTE